MNNNFMISLIFGKITLSKTFLAAWYDCPFFCKVQFLYPVFEDGTFLNSALHHFFVGGSILYFKFSVYK